MDGHPKELIRLRELNLNMPNLFMIVNMAGEYNSAKDKYTDEQRLSIQALIALINPLLINNR